MNGKSLWEIPEEKHRFVTDEIILATATISGCGLPESELLGKYLSDELIRFLLDFGYEDYTVDEIITAVRLNTSGTGMIKNPAGDDLYTKEPTPRVSVAFIAGVLNNYKILRKNIDRVIENKLSGY